MKVMTMPRVAALAALGLMAAVLVAVVGAGGGGAGGDTAHAQEAEADDGGSGVTVEAVETVSGTPDVMNAQVGVEVVADSTQAAYEQANEAAAQVRDALVSAGVDGSDIQTAQLSLREEVPQGPEPEQEEADGYQASTTLSVELRDLDRAGGVIDEAVAAGGDSARLHGMGFSLDDESELAEQAREEAFAAAEEKAGEYADLADGSLGELEAITETEQPGAGPVAGGMGDQSAETDGAAIEPGQEEVAVRVRATWALN